MGSTNNELIGKKILAIREITQKERDMLGWDAEENVIVIDLEGEISLYPSRDEEMNGPGEIFGFNKKGNWSFMVKPLKEINDKKRDG